MEQKPEAFYRKKANKAIFAIQGNEGMNPIDCTIVIGMVAAKLVEAYVRSGGDKEWMIDVICKAVKTFSK